jgi:hypothetical protein
MDNNEFAWDDAMVMEFCRFAYHSYMGDGKMGEFIRAFREKWESEHKPNPEWEILAYQECGGMSDLKPGTISQRHPNWNYAVVKNFPIHSVKRLSDGEVFTVGDEVEYDGRAGINRFEIEKFNVRQTSMMACNLGFDLNISILRRSTREIEPTIPVSLTSSQLEKLHKILNNS